MSKPIKSKNLFATALGMGPAMIPAVFISAVIVGCGPPAENPNVPPQANEVFSVQVDGAFLGPGPAVVLLDPEFVGADNLGSSGLLDPAICYTTDGTLPNYAGGLCFGGTTDDYKETGIWLRCKGDVGNNVPRTINLVYEWDNNGTITQETISANYSILCVELPETTLPITVSGVGVVSGAGTGSLSASGFGTFDTVTGTIAWQAVTSSITEIPLFGTNKFVLTSTAELIGNWSDPSFEITSDLSEVMSCDQTSGTFGICALSGVGDPPADMGAFTPNTIVFDSTAPGGQATFELELIVETIVGDAFTNTDYVITIQ